MSDNDDFIGKLIAAGIIVAIGSVFLFRKKFGNFKKGDEVTEDELTSETNKNTDKFKTVVTVKEEENYERECSYCSGKATRSCWGCGAPICDVHDVWAGCCPNCDD